MLPAPSRDKILIPATAVSTAIMAYSCSASKMKSNTYDNFLIGEQTHDVFRSGLLQVERPRRDMYIVYSADADNAV